MFAYIDESGDTGKSKKSSKSFITTSIVVEDELILPRLARNVFKKKVYYKDKVNQLHASKDTYKVHNAILKELEKLSYHSYFFDDKDYFRNLETHIKFLSSIGVVKIFIAIRNGNKTYIKKINDLGIIYSIQIVQTTVTANKGLQIVDFISWAIFKKLEFGDEIYFSKINSEKLQK